MKYLYQSLLVVIFLVTGCISTKERFVDAKDVTVNEYHKEQVEYFKCLSKRSDVNQLICYAQTWQKFHTENIRTNNEDEVLAGLDSAIPAAYHQFFRESQSLSYQGGNYLLSLAGYYCQDPIEVRELFLTEGYLLSCGKHSYLLLEKENSWLISSTQ